MSSFDEIKASLQKSAKGNRLMILSDSDVAKTGDFLHTPTYDLNRILSGSLYNGVVAKTHTVLVGPEASGKSSYMCIALAEAQRMGYTPFIIDAEGAWTDTFVARWGIDPTRAIILHTPWIEEIMVELAKIIENKWTKLAIAVDSIGAVETFKLVDDGNDGEVKADQGTLQKKVKRMLKMLVDITKRQDSVSFSAAHYYGNPTGYGDTEQIGGGKYLKLSADYIVTLKKSPIYENPLAKTVKEKGNIVGTQIKAATLKNRIYPPFQEAMIEINYKDGVNKLAGLVDVAVDLGLIVKGGAWYDCPSLGKKIQGEASLYEFLRSLTPEELKPFLDTIEQHLQTTGYSTVNAKLEELIIEEEHTESLEEGETETTPKGSRRAKKV